MEKPVIILGAGGMARAAVEIFISNNVIIYGLLDDDKKLHGNEIHNIKILGSTEDSQFLDLIGEKCESFVAIDETKYKKSLVDLLVDNKKSMPVNAIHQKAFISESASLGHGNMINAFVFLGAFSNIGNHCILNSRVSIDHDVRIGDFVQIGMGSNLNSGVEIGEEAFIGSGVTIVSGVKIGKKARVGAGSLVISDVKANETVFGNPAQKVKA